MSLVFLALIYQSTFTAFLVVLFTYCDSSVMAIPRVGQLGQSLGANIGQKQHQNSHFETLKHLITPKERDLIRA